MWIGYIVINSFYKYAQGSAAVPVRSFFVLSLLYWLVYIPICFSGAYLGFRKSVSPFSLYT
jgi:hypothetical protein